MAQELFLSQCHVQVEYSIVAIPLMKLNISPTVVSWDFKADVQ